MTSNAFSTSINTRKPSIQRWHINEDEHKDFVPLSNTASSMK